jgi:RNA-binding protein
MITPAQRARLRAAANGIDTILHVGKGGVAETVIGQADSALAARELIKGRVLDNSPLSAREAMDALASACGAEGVFTAGSRFVLYRENTKLPGDRRISLDK